MKKIIEKIKAIEDREIYRDSRDTFLRDPNIYTLDDFVADKVAQEVMDRTSGNSVLVVEIAEFLHSSPEWKKLEEERENGE